MVGNQPLHQMVVRFLAKSLSGNNSGQVFHSHVPLSPSSINRYWQKLGSK